MLYIIVSDYFEKSAINPLITVITIKTKNAPIRTNRIVFSAMKLFINGTKKGTANAAIKSNRNTIKAASNNITIIFTMPSTLVHCSHE